MVTDSMIKSRGKKKKDLKNSKTLDVENSCLVPNPSKQPP